MKWINKSALSLAIAGLVLASAAIAAPQQATDIPAYVTAAIADPGRAADAKDDSRRHIAEIVAFSGVKPGDSVLELVPGSGYWSKVFSKIIGDQGHLYAAVPEPMKKYSDETMTLPKSYPNIEVLVQPANALATPAPVDVAFTVQNYHDYPDKFMGPTDPALLNKAVFAALKPGGVYIVVDHVAEAGSGLRGRNTGYFSLAFAQEIAPSTTLKASVGFTRFASDIKDGGVPNYMDYQVGGAYDFGGGLSLAAAVAGANKKSYFGDANKPRLLLTLTKTL